jgi:MscS family membrane protein
VNAEGGRTDVVSRAWRLRAAGIALTAALWLPGVQAQERPPSAEPPGPRSSAAPVDPLGRSTPRGTVYGFLGAARRADFPSAAQYLDTSLRGERAAALAEQLFTVLDARLPARLTAVSDAPTGSRADPLAPDHELVGTIDAATGPVNIVVRRVTRSGTDPVWLFSRPTLEAVPGLYDEVRQVRANRLIPRALTDTRAAGVPLIEWLALLLGLPLLYTLTLAANRLVTPVASRMWRRLAGGVHRFNRDDALPLPARLLLMALVTRWVISAAPLSLLTRQALSSAAAVTVVVSVTWLLLLLVGEAESYGRRRIVTVNTGAVSLLRLLRRGVDALVIFGGLLAMLRHLAIDPTPALAGLGVGGIAVALAAQKTLENVIAGASLIFDQAVRVGDVLKMGEISGTVEQVGLRSTRIRTLDRTIVSVPNSQIANASIETMSARDKFWFHHVVGLRYETTPDQLHIIIDAIHGMLEAHPAIDPEIVRVRLLRLGAFSLDVDIFAYLRATDWNQFLEIQEQLLFRITEIVHGAGASIAFPSQTMYVEDTGAAAGVNVTRGR